MSDDGRRVAGDDRAAREVDDGTSSGRSASYATPLGLIAITPGRAVDGARVPEREHDETRVDEREVRGDDALAELLEHLEAPASR